MTSEEENNIMKELFNCKHKEGFNEIINNKGFKDFYCRNCNKKVSCKHNKNKSKNYLENGLIEIKCNVCNRFKLFEKEIWSLSYGGGVNSSALKFYLKKTSKPLDLGIMADTGDESKITMDTANKMKKIFEIDNIPFIITKSHLGKLTDYYIRKNAIPSIVKRDCTSKFKIGPIIKYYKSIYDTNKTLINQYIGIAYDESHRVSISPNWFMHSVFPFVDDKIDRKGNEDILKENNFKAVKSGCMGCPFQSKENWAKLLKTNRKEFEIWEYLESNNSKFPKLKLNPSWSITLTQFKNNILLQKDLKSFFQNDIKEEDMVCKNTLGGCFL